MNWSVEWCTTSHPAAAPALIPLGLVSLINVGTKVLFFLQLTRRLAAPAGGEPARLVLPIVYDMADNMTQCADRKDYQPNQVTVLTAETGVPRLVLVNWTAGVFCER